MKQNGGFIRRGAASIIEKKRGMGNIVGIVAGLILVLIAVGFAFGVDSSDPGDPTAGPGASGPALGGCILNDSAFTDTSTLRTADDVISKLPDDKKPLLDSAEQRKRVDDIITKSITAGVNPTIIVALWYAETGWKDDAKSLDKAFGVGKLGGGKTIAKFIGWENQLSGGIDTIKHAINSDGLFTPIPGGSGIWDRFMYHYVAADKIRSWENYGYTTPKGDARFQILNYLVPEQITCTASTTGLAVPYLNQCQAKGPSPKLPDWSLKNPKGALTRGDKNICTSGCHLVSMTMITQFMTGENINPYDLGVKFSSPASFSAGEAEAASGLKLDPFTNTGYNEFPMAEIRAKIALKEPILWQMAKYTGDSQAAHPYGHFNVIIGVSPSGDIITNDPGNKSGKSYVYKSSPDLYGGIPVNKNAVKPFKFYFYAFKK